jgi:hypothetical protein
VKTTLAVLVVVTTLILIAVGTLFPSSMAPVRGVAGSQYHIAASTNTPDGATEALLEKVESRDFHGAYGFVANTNEVSEAQFARSLTGSYEGLLTTAALQPSDVRVLRKSGDTAQVRVAMNWSTAVGAFHETRDLKVIREATQWKVVWPVTNEPRVPPQVISVNYLRWDVIYRGAGDDWGAQEAEAPHIRIIAMNAVPRADSVIVMGEILNEDTVPAFVSVKASLVDKNGSVFAQESGFDKMMHLLLPKEVSPFRIDFPRTKLADVKSVRMQPSSTLVAASADPVIEVGQQRLDTDERGRRVLRGQLVNSSGQVINIPHVIGTFYDSGGQIVWVSDSYVDRPLLPQIAVPFAIDVPDDVAAKIQTYRVVANQYSVKRPS